MSFGEARMAFSEATFSLEAGSGGNGAVRSPVFELYAVARYNLVCALSLAGRFEEAQALLPEVRDLFRAGSKPLDRVRLRLGGSAHRLRAGPAGGGGSRVPGGPAAVPRFSDGHQRRAGGARPGGSEQGRTRELKELSVELLSVFEARAIHRESLAVLLLFQRSCEEERLTAELARQFASLLKRAKG